LYQNICDKGIFEVLLGEVAAAAQHLYEVRPCRDRRGFDLISDALPFGVIRALDESGSVIETHEYSGDFREP
jgi:hypothetical protein